MILTMEFWKIFIFILLFSCDLSNTEIGLTEHLSLTTIQTPVSFTSPDAVLRLIPWDFVKYSKLELQFHTREPKGIILFIGSASASHGCLGLELFNYNLYGFGQMVSKEFRFQLNPPDVPVSSGQFHKVVIQMHESSYLTIQLDSFPVSERILVPGKLEFDSYTYVGGIDSPSRLPWQAYSHEGFAGCINYMRVNDDRFIDVLQYSKVADMRGTQTGVCQTTIARCLPGVCGPGKCHERSFNLLDNSRNFYCDCSGTSKSYSFTAVDILRGETCSIDAPTFNCNTKSYILFTFEREKATHIDEISIDFKTTNLKESLFLMKAGSGDSINTFISAEVIVGRVFVVISLYNDRNLKQSFNSQKSNLNNGQWHTLKILRYGENIEMYVDEKETIIRGSHHFTEHHEKFFNRVKEIFLGSITRALGNDKCGGELRNFYWNGEDLLGKRNRPHQYISQMITDKPVLPVLPPFPRQPPRPCTVTPNHQYSLLNGIPLTKTNGIFVIEFKTKYNGIIWHASTSYPSNHWLTILVSSNSVALVYFFESLQGAHVVEVTRGGLMIRDNMWHRIVVDINKLKEIIYLHIDDIESITSEIPIPGLQNQLANIDNMIFSIGGIQDSKIYQNFLRILQNKAVDIANDLSPQDESKFVGCLGDLLTNNNNFSKNALKQEMLTLPTNSMICRACQENMVKCPKNHCQNNGKCYNINDEKIACNCHGTGFHGRYCDIKNPTCTPNACKNGGLCQIVENNRICNCSGTGYIGLECETSRCSNFNCLNNGVCLIKYGLPECDCSSTMYSGFHCEVPKCPPNFCLSNGKCLMDKATQRPYCACNGTGYTGFRCDTPICPQDQCKNNGKCEVRDDKPVCYCSQEFMGNRCEKSICSSDECLNGGTCNVVNRKPLCTCAAFYEGSRCELAKPCPIGFCLYGGHCRIVSGVPTCNCSSTDYTGIYCEKPKSCPNKYCENGGTCSVVGNNFACNCLNTGYAGDRCTNKIECPVGYCKNDGICGITNGKFVCDCSGTAYRGDLCSERANGILCDYKKPGYSISLFQPPIISEGITTSIGFQTFVKTGTLFCFETAGDKYWSVKLREGKPVVDINGMLFYMKTLVNDGQYYLLRISRDNVNFMFTINNPSVETLVIPTQMTSILTLPNNIIIYSKLTLCNSCPDTTNADRFQGTINNVRFGTHSISDQIKNGVGFMIGSVQHILAPMTPLPPIPNIIPCPPDHCKNGGLCSIKNYGLSCNCGLSGFTGGNCNQTMYIMKSVPPKPGYVITDIVPSVAKSLDMMDFMAQWSESSSPLLSWITNKGHFIEIKLKNDQIYVNNNGELVGPLNSQPLQRNVPHFFRSVNLLGRLTLYLNGTKIGHTQLSEPVIMKNGSIQISRVIVGANQKLTETIKGFLGNYRHNDDPLISSNGSLIPPSIPVHTIKIEPWLKVKRLLIAPTQIRIGHHGGVVFKHSSLAYLDGFGAGLIIHVSGGPFIVGAQFFSMGAISVNPIILGLILSLILLAVAIIWALGHFVFRTASTPALSDGILVGAAGLKTLPLLSSNGIGHGYTLTSYMGTTSHQAIGDVTKSNQDQTDFSGVSTVSNRLHVNNAHDLSSGVENANFVSGNKTNDLYLTSTTANLVGKAHSAAINKSISGANEHGTLLQSNKDMNVENFQSLKNWNNYTLQEGHLNHSNQQSNVFTEGELKLDCCLLTNDSKYAVTGSISGPPQIWNLADGSLIHIMDGENQACTSLYLAVGDSILIGLIDQNQYPVNLKMLKMWHFPEGDIIEFENDMFCTTCCVSDDGQSLIVAEDMKESSITILNLINGKRLRMFYNKSENVSIDGIQLLKCSKLSRFIIAGYQTADSTSFYMVFDMNKSKTGESGVIKTKSNIHCCDMINSSEMVIGTLNGELIIWNLSSLQVVRQIAVSSVSNGRMNSPLAPHDGPINCLSVSKDNSILVSGGYDSRVKVWTMDDENLLHTWDKHDNEVHSLAISNDNEMIASGSADGSIRIWHTNNGCELCSFSSNIEIKKVLLSSDKTVIVGLGERSGIHKLVMLKILRNVHHVKRNINTTDGFSSPTL